jgi:hypothetical protein
MAIPSANTTNISLGPTLIPTSRSIAGEFSDPDPHSLSEFYRQGPLVPNNAANAGIPTSGPISMSQFNGATSAPAALSYTLTCAQNLNLYTYATAQAPVPTRYVAGAPGQTLNFTIPPTVTIGSAARTQTALAVGPRSPTTFFPDVTVTLTNQGTVKGAGGTGGGGGPAPSSASPFPASQNPGSPGLSGGNALTICPGHCVVPLFVITNNGTLASGGGGGGGGRGVSAIGCSPPLQPNVVGDGGGGGGGGAGQIVGAGGVGGTGKCSGCNTGYEGQTGTDGGATTGGTGGQGGAGSATAGGNGGALGLAGQIAVGIPAVTGGAAGVAAVGLQARPLGGTVQGPTT